MANLKSSDGMNYPQPVQKRDPELGAYEASESSDHFRDPSMYVETYPSMYVQASPIIPGVEPYNVKMEVTSTSVSSENVSDICRVCMTRTNRENMLPIFDHLSFADRVIWVLDLPMFEGDGLPHLLCINCRARVDAAFELKTLAWHSDKDLLRQANNQQTRENTFLEDIAQVNLPEIEEDQEEDMTPQVNGIETSPPPVRGGLRILSCTSLTKAEEELLLSGKLKGDGGGNEAASPPMHVGTKGKDKSHLYKNYYNHRDFVAPSKRGRPRKVVTGLEPPTKKAKPAKKNGDVAQKRGRPRKILALRDEVPDASPLGRSNLPAVVTESSSSTIPLPDKDSRLTVAVDQVDELNQKTEEPSTKIAERKPEEREAVAVPDEKEVVPKTAISGEKERDIAETSDPGNETKLSSIENQGNMEISPQETKNLPSSAGEKNVDQLAVEADKPSLVVVDNGKEGRCSPLGSPDQGNDRDSCDEGSTVEECVAASTKYDHPSEVSAEGPSTPSSIGVCKGKEEAVALSTKSNHPREPSTLRPIDVCKGKEEAGSDVKIAPNISVVQKPLPGLKEEPTVARRGRGRPRKVFVEDELSGDASDDETSAASPSSTIKEELENEEDSSLPFTADDKCDPLVNKKIWSCADCEREYGLKKDLTAHLTNYGTRSLMKCSYCQALFCNLGRYNTHVRLHKSGGNLVQREKTEDEGDEPPPPKVAKKATVPIDKKVWNCADCKKEFPFKKNLTAHLTNHGTRSTMECSFCCAVYCSLPRYNTHVRTHKGHANKSFDCEVCSAKFFRATDLQTHCRVHVAGEVNQCDVCGKTLPSKAGLEAHVKTEHTKEKLFKCKVCDKPFTFLGSMKDHVRLKHPGEYVHQCDSCQKTYETAEELQEHITTHVGVSCFTCQKCNKKFSIKAVYKSHVRNHDRARPYICETCGKSFLNKSALQCHQRVHTGDRPFKCHVCEKAYGHPNTLRSHLMSHTDERCYSCSICGKSFRGKGTLKSHMVAHSNLREFKCAVCGLEFLYKGNLNRHLDNMHGRLVGTKDTGAEQDSE